MKKLFAILAILVALVASAQAQTRKVVIYKAFYHEEGHYSVIPFAPGQEVGVVHYRLWNTDAKDARFKFDVPATERIWLETDYYTESGFWSTSTTCSRFVFHLHSADEIGGGSWERQAGKQIVHGTTHPIP